MTGTTGAAFFYANAGDKGYYRTAYAAEQLKAIVANVETGLTAQERIGLLGDRWALMRAGEGSVGEFLDLALGVKADPSATVLESALGKIGAIGTQIATDEDRKRLDGVVRREFGGVYAGLGRAEGMNRTSTRTCARRCSRRWGGRAIQRCWRRRRA